MILASVKTKIGQVGAYNIGHQSVSPTQDVTINSVFQT